ncbi:MAG: SCO1664 family protein [Nocardioidaceae bacterium]
MRSDERTAVAAPGVEAILTHGSLELQGRLVSASNASFLGSVELDGHTLSCIYKPVAGERPLWDFPHGTLAGRERAARLVSQVGGWGVVPPTVLREGRFGRGMVQEWIEVTDEQALVDVVPADVDRPGWVGVLEAEDQHGRPVQLVHADDPRLRDMAVFDVVINNADRKGGHVLVDSDGSLWGCDHGVSFHEDDKLRTVLWGWAEGPLRAQDLEALQRVRTALTGEAGTGLEELASLLTPAEIGALGQRVDALVATRHMPMPDGSWPAIPWPPF